MTSKLFFYIFILSLILRRLYVSTVSVWYKSYIPVATVHLFSTLHSVPSYQWLGLAMVGKC